LSKTSSLMEALRFQKL